jgi:hypothetical protein
VHSIQAETSSKSGVIQVDSDCDVIGKGVDQTGHFVKLREKKFGLQRRRERRGGILPQRTQRVQRLRDKEGEESGINHQLTPRRVNIEGRTLNNRMLDQGGWFTVDGFGA